MATAEQTDYEVGQQLWVARGNGLAPIYVVKVGRQWVSYAYYPPGSKVSKRVYRFDRKTGAIERSGLGASPGYIYTDKDVWRAKRHRSELISRIHMLCGSPGVLRMFSTEQLEAILEIVSQAEQKQD